MLEAEHPACSAEPGLNLVKHEQNPPLSTDLPELLEIPGRRDIDARLALNGFDQYPNGVLVDCFLERLDIVVWNRHAPIQRVSSTKTGVIQKICGGPRTGDHSPRCLLIATGPNVVPGEIDSAISVEAIAPTLTEMLGIELSDADGVSFLSDISAK